jgi:hypothetical protein
VPGWFRVRHGHDRVRESSGNAARRGHPSAGMSGLLGLFGLYLSITFLILYSRFVYTLPTLY